MPSRRPSRLRSATPAVLIRHIVAIVAVIVVAGCSGGGCGGGCSSCGGLTPLAGGFDPAHRIENAGSVRITQSGLGFLSQNLGSLAKGILGGMGTGGVITFDVPQSSGSRRRQLHPLPERLATPTRTPSSASPRSTWATRTSIISTAGPYDLHVTGTIPIRVAGHPGPGRPRHLQPDDQHRPGRRRLLPRQRELRRHPGRRRHRRSTSTRTWPTRRASGTRRSTSTRSSTRPR